MKQIIPDLIVLLFFSIGLAASGAAIYTYRSRQDLIKNGVGVNGTVVDLIRTSRKSYVKAPSIQYVDANGRVKVYHHSVATNPPKYDIGQQVTLYYDRERPNDIQLPDDYLMVYIFAAFGVVFLLLSIWSVPESVGSLWKWTFGNTVAG